jgi:hypothetical protein
MKETQRMTAKITTAILAATLAIAAGASALILAIATAASAAPAFAQLPPVSIENIRGFAGAGMAPLNADIKVLHQCPEITRWPADMTPAEVTEARALRIDPGALWLRRNDAVIAKCLAGLSAEQRRID